jgi:hypothetical protein
MDFMAEPFAMIGVGNTFLMIAGTLEIIAGLCLLYPRSGGRRRGSPSCRIGDKSR